MKINLGFYETAEEAAKMWDMACVYYKIEGAKLNFPENLKEYQTLNLREIIQSKIKTKKSRFRGVAKNKSGGWRAYAYQGRKQINLGDFSTEEEAATARATYDEKFRTKTKYRDVFASQKANEKFLTLQQKAQESTL